MAKKPRVIVHSVADRYAPAGERIIEVSFDGGAGALISLRQGDGVTPPKIEVYRTDGAVMVVAPRSEVERQYALDETTRGILQEGQRAADDNTRT